MFEFVRLKSPFPVGDMFLIGLCGTEVISKWRRGLSRTQPGTGRGKRIIAMQEGAGGASWKREGRRGSGRSVLTQGGAGGVRGREDHRDARGSGRSVLTQGGAGGVRGSGRSKGAGGVRGSGRIIATHQIAKERGGILQEPRAPLTSLFFWPQQELSCSTAMDCFKSADACAVNATLLFNFRDDRNNLWSRNGTVEPLESCLPLQPQQFPCTVCRHNGMVYAMCEKLGDGVEVMMEADGISSNINISKSDCPAPPAPPADAQQFQQLGIIIGIIIIIIIIIGVFLYCKCCRNRPQTRNEIQNTSQEMKVMVSTAGATEEKQTPPLLSCCTDGINCSQQPPCVQQL